MIYHIAIGEDRVYITARMESPGAIGDFFHSIGPGESFEGVTYDEFIEHGPGPMDIGPQEP